MTNKNLIERLRWQSQNNNVLPEHGMMQEAAEIIEWQNVHIKSIIKNVPPTATYDFMQWLSECYPQTYFALPDNAATALDGSILRAIEDEMK